MKRYIHKKEIPDSQDWKTDTSDNTINAFREIMAHNNQYVDDPYVGIFWYDTENQELFGVYSVLAEDVDYYYSDAFGAKAKTCKPLHYALWQKGANKNKDSRFQAKYTDVPRGRVFEVENQGFIVCVGKWINDCPEAKAEILYEFQLPNDTEFVIDSHWGFRTWLVG